jgi:hypothetical protein
MRTFQFWTLVILSTLVSALMIREIFLSRAYEQQQRNLAETQETITQGNGYENAWKQLATKIYEAARQDPAMTEVLKAADLQVRPAPPAAGSTPTQASAPGAAASKGPVAPLSPPAP